ncbi:PAS domain S-box protein [Thermodesulfobacteriota bacterium]
MSSTLSCTSRGIQAPWKAAATEFFFSRLHEEEMSLELWGETAEDVFNCFAYLLEIFLTEETLDSYHSSLQKITDDLGRAIAGRHRNENLSFDDFYLHIKLLRGSVASVLPGFYRGEEGEKSSRGLHGFFDLLESVSFTRWVGNMASGLRKEIRKSNQEIRYERKRYALIFHRIVEPAFVVDSSLRLVDVNRAFEDFFEVKSALVIGKKCCDIVGGKTCDFCVVKDIISKKSSLANVEMNLQVRDQMRTVEMAGAFLGVTRNSPSHGLIIIQDLTEKKQIVSALQQSEEKYRSLVENMPEATWRVDQDGNLIYLSPNIKTITGYSAEEIISSGPAGRSAMIHEDDAESVRDEFGKLFTEQCKFDIRYRFKSRDGQWIWLHDRAGEIYEKDGLRMADGMVSDISELYQIQEELEAYRDWLEDLVDERTEELKLSNEQLKREVEVRQSAEEQLMKIALSLKKSNTELEQFAHVASHDLKEPLLLIVAFSERLLHRYGHDLDESGGEYLRRILIAAKKMQQLVEGLLQLSRVTTSNRPFEPIDLTDVVHEVVEDLEETISKAGGSVAFGVLHQVEGDRVQVRQLFQNMIANSLKYRRAEVDPIISISTALVEGDMCEIHVEDNGIGFDAKHVSRIFNPFERLDVSGDYEGSGIGLTTCKKIVSRHGGEITARSVPGKGAVFVVRIPVHQEQQKATIL